MVSKSSDVLRIRPVDQVLGVGVVHQSVVFVVEKEGCPVLVTPKLLGALRMVYPQRGHLPSQTNQFAQGGKVLLQVLILAKEVHHNHASTIHNVPTLRLSILNKVWNENVKRLVLGWYLPAPRLGQMPLGGIVGSNPRPGVPNKGELEPQNTTQTGDW